MYRSQVFREQFTGLIMLESFYADLQCFCCALQTSHMSLSGGKGSARRRVIHPVALKSCLQECRCPRRLLLILRPLGWRHHSLVERGYRLFRLDHSRGREGEIYLVENADDRALVSLFPSSLPAAAVSSMTSITISASVTSICALAMPSCSMASVA